MSCVVCVWLLCMSCVLACWLDGWLVVGLIVLLAKCVYVRSRDCEFDWLLVYCLCVCARVCLFVCLFV